jgi:hypothetical protein
MYADRDEMKRMIKANPGLTSCCFLSFMCNRRYGSEMGGCTKCWRGCRGIRNRFAEKEPQRRTERNGVERTGFPGHTYIHRKRERERDREKKQREVYFPTETPSVIPAIPPAGINHSEVLLDSLRSL